MGRPEQYPVCPFFISPRSIPEPYPNRTKSVHSSVRSTSVRRNYGLGTEQVRLGYGINRTECLAAYSYRAQHRWSCRPDRVLNFPLFQYGV